MINSTRQAFPYVQSYWMMDQSFEKSPALAGEHNTDVVVIGGGYAGLATALGLIEQQPDLRVTLLEAKHIGYGASGRNGGHILNLLPHTWWLRDLSKEKNAANVHLYIEMAAEQVSKINTLLQEENIDIELEKNLCWDCCSQLFWGCCNSLAPWFCFTVCRCRNSLPRGRSRQLADL